MRLTMTMFQTLDGVVQGPGGPAEDTTGGFRHGGWLVPFFDGAMAETVGGWFGRADAFLLGRGTYDIFAAAWPNSTDPSDPVATALNSLPKYVASRGRPQLLWANSTLLEGEAADAVDGLRARPGRELQVHGSPGLAQTLLRHRLVDELRLITFPVVLGTGKRLFGEGAVPTSMLLTGPPTPTSTGAVISSYGPGGEPEYGTAEVR